MNTKALLRHPAAVSPMEAFGAATTFLPVITSKPANNRSATLVIFCSGKIAYDLEARRDERNLHHVAVVRIEQLAPFPVAELVETLKTRHRQCLFSSRKSRKTWERSITSAHGWKPCCAMPAGTFRFCGLLRERRRLRPQAVSTDCMSRISRP